eukprot:5674340-Amphidinium_carterae.1
MLRACVPACLHACAPACMNACVPVLLCGSALWNSLLNRTRRAFILGEHVWAPDQEFEAMHSNCTCIDASSSCEKTLLSGRVGVDPFRA